MKLTIIQIILIREALQEAERSYLAMAEADPQPQLKDYWSKEAKTAAELQAIFKSTYTVEVEIDQPTTHECGDIMCQGHRRTASEVRAHAEVANRLVMCAA